MVKTKSIWSKEIPKKEGWYWIKYRGKHGIVMCPASVGYIGQIYFVRTANNDFFNPANEKQFGWFKIGPEIPIPN